MTEEEFKQICSKAASEMINENDFKNYIFDTLQKKFYSESEISVILNPGSGPLFITSKSMSKSKFFWEGNLASNKKEGLVVIAFS